MSEITETKIICDFCKAKIDFISEEDYMVSYSERGIRIKTKDGYIDFCHSCAGKIDNFIKIGAIAQFDKILSVKIQQLNDLLSVTRSN